MKLDSNPAVQESKLPHALRNYVEAYFRFFENERVGLECYTGPPLLGLALYQKLRFRLAALVALKVNLAVAPDFDFQVLAQSVYHGYARPRGDRRRLCRSNRRISRPHGASS